MNKNQFINYIKNTESLDHQSVKMLEQLSEDFPFCQTSIILHVINLFNIKHFLFDKKLNLAAAYASDRKKLKFHIDEIAECEEQEQTLPDEYPEKKSEPITAKESHASKTDEKDSVLSELNIPKYVIDDTLDINKEEERIRNMKKIIENRLKEIQEEKKRREKQSGHAKEKTAHTPKTASNLDKHKDLIDKFIQDEPSITPPKVSFYNPNESARKSIVDEENIVSETLAKIYQDQGHYEKAIKIYNLLGLKYPEKISYFAARIEILKNENKNLKKK